MKKSSVRVAAQLTLSCVSLLATACGGPAAEVSSAEDNLFDRSAVRGRGVHEFPVPTAGRPSELCVLPNGIPGADYSKGDRKDEDALCSYNFHSTDPGTPVAICPKLVSTNTGVDVHELLDGKTQQETEAATCRSANRPNKLLAKFKQSITCSYTPSILSYYHLSRALGGAGGVKPAVVRTMDLEEHKKITRQGIQFTAGKGLINELWRSYASSEADPAHSTRKNLVFTTDLMQIYGAMQENSRGEVKYPGINVRSQGDISAAFRQTSAWRRVTDARSVRDFVQPTFAEISASDRQAGKIPEAHKIIQMADIADMVLMDQVLSQQDRYGNIHAIPYYYYAENGVLSDIKKVKKSKVDDGEAQMPAGAVLVYEMLMKDNDCGVTKTNVAKNAHMLQQVAHMKPKTYKQFRWFAEEFASNPEVQAAFRDEFLFTDADISRIGANIAEAKEILESRCRSGKLMLDLKLEDHLSGINTKESVLAQCEEMGGPAEEEPEPAVQPVDGQAPIF